MCRETVAAPPSLQDIVYPILSEKSLHFCEKCEITKFSHSPAHKADLKTRSPGTVQRRCPLQGTVPVQERLFKRCPKTVQAPFWMILL